jgi:ABC-type proline/glycine betaine transport system ATPase subunit
VAHMSVQCTVCSVPWYLAYSPRKQTGRTVKLMTHLDLSPRLMGTDLYLHRPPTLLHGGLLRRAYG